jgi:Mrp family chromosome partitioning ATPase
MGFMLIDTPPGDGEIRLHFVTPIENRVGQGIALVTVLLIGAMVLFRRRWEPFV